MNPRNILFVLLAFFVASAACGQERKAVIETTTPVSTDRPMLVSTNWLADRLDATDVVVLHVAADRKHYDAAHIPGARFVGWSEITATRGGIPNELAPVEALGEVFTNAGIGNDARVILYGDKKGLSAARAFFTLAYLGHGERAALLDGGLEKWQKENRPVSTDPAAVTAAPFQPALEPDIIVARDVVADASRLLVGREGAPVALIDARPVAEYSGEKPGEGVSRGGHIPGAVNVFWERTLSDDVPTFRDRDELEALYREAGAAEGIPVITYCRTGGQSAVAWFVARYLGYDAKMYDGSYYEWEKDRGLPVVRSGE